MPIILLLQLLLTFQFSTVAVPSTYIHNHPRRQLLHQPFFPNDFIFPPTQPPTWSPQPQSQPQQQPKLPFSSSSSSSSFSSPPQLERPFFPSYHSPPPPPSPTALTSFPANISSLLFPQTSSSHPHRRRRLALVVAASLLSAALIAAFAAAFLYHRRRKNHETASTDDLDKAVSASRSDSLRLFPANTATSDGGFHKSRGGTPNHSSEFLYLGTIVNSRGGGADHREAAAAAAANSSNAGIKIGVSSASPYRKLGSPELKPLPPLPKHNFRTYRRNGSDEGEDDEEFFSPRGSAADTSSPGRVGSSSRREAHGFKVDNFGSRRSFNSRTTSYPCSKSPSPSQTTTSSPASLKSRSPDSIVNFIAPPPPSRRPPSPSLSSSSSSPSERGLSPKKQSPVKQFVAVKLPPPPPPPPPARFWEIPAQRRRWSSEGPPVLVTPWRAFQNVERVSKEGEEAEHNVNVERNEEESLKKPKLKPLHWDKVRASSDRAMVWDHLKSSSFQ